MDVLSSIGIDLNAVVFYLINFGILLAVVYYFVSSPILNILDERRNTIANNVEEAERLKNEFFKEKQQLDAENKELRSTIEQKLSELNREMEERRKQQEQEIEERKQTLLAEARETIEQEKAQLITQAKSEIVQLMEKIVLSIVKDNLSPEMVKKSVEEAWSSYNKSN